MILLLFVVSSLLCGVCLVFVFDAILNVFSSFANYPAAVMWVSVSLSCDALGWSVIVAYHSY